MYESYEPINAPVYPKLSLQEILKQQELKTGLLNMELKALRSQMNPHFIFNALNSIRALVDEDPKKSKIAITFRDRTRNQGANASIGITN